MWIRTKYLNANKLNKIKFKNQRIIIHLLQDYVKNFRIFHFQKFNMHLIN